MNSIMNLKNTIKTHTECHDKLSTIRPDDGYRGLIAVMRHQLANYVAAKQGEMDGDEADMYGIEAAKEAIDILERIEDPDAFLARRRQEVASRYPALREWLICGGNAIFGWFAPQNEGWAGIEGHNQSVGYFTVINGNFERVCSPDPAETRRLVDEIFKYRKAMRPIYAQAEDDVAEQFDRLCGLLKDNMYYWTHDDGSRDYHHGR